MAEAVQVRRATRDDMRAVHTMIHELAAYEGVPEGPQLSVQDLIEDGFECSPPWFFVLVAEVDTDEDSPAADGVETAADGHRPTLAGYALCNHAYSSWTRRALYLEDLYVRPEYRRHGIAARLLQALCQIAVAEGVGRIDWHVLIDNAPAQAFYRRIGARDLRTTEQRAALRLDAPHIERLATTHTYSAAVQEQNKQNTE